jgi:glyoxylase-like metal-dependent hydrolase (beta-lactamase superfamily II)
MAMCGVRPLARKEYESARTSERSETMELAKGVHVLDTYAATTVLTDNRLVLVDTGVADQASKLLDGLSKLNVRPRDLTTIFITHVHPDHVGGLATVKRDSMAKVAASPVEAEFISKKRTYDGPPGPEHQRHPGTPVDLLLRDGQTQDGLRVIFTPGHTRGSISLLDEAHSLLIAGDAFRNEGGVSPMGDEYNVNPKEHRESIKKLARFHFESAVMGHGAPIKSGASAKVVELAKRI